MSETETKATTGDPKGDEPLGKAGYNALVAEREENKALKRKIEKLEKSINDANTAQLSKEEKLQHDLNEALAKVQELESEKEQNRIRRSIAADTGVPEDLISGTDEESMKASAEKLKSYIGDATSPKQPAPNPHLGGSDTEGGGNDNEAALRALGF